MTLTQVQPVTTVSVTDNAAQAIKDMLAKRDLVDHALRVFISGGGCSGYQYGMALEGEIRASDFVSEQAGVKVAIDDVSMNYLRGAVIDYVDDVMGSGFKIENPNAARSCGCGTSFEPTDADSEPAYDPETMDGSVCGGTD